MKMVLFVNDSYFAYLLAKPVIEKFSHEISAVIFSNMIRGSIPRIYNVYKKTYPTYFCYRALIEIIARVNTHRGHKTVKSLVKEYNLRSFSEANVNKSKVLNDILPGDLGVAFNFDQILKQKLLNSFSMGVMNVHASKLPHDKGISPVLWAFARGDNTVWSTIYRMESGIDTGSVYQQIRVPVEQKDTAFKLYERVCTSSGLSLAEKISNLKKGTLVPIRQSTNDEGNYWGWPDSTHKEMMNTSKRHFIGYKDIMSAIQKERADAISYEKKTCQRHS